MFSAPGGFDTRAILEALVALGFGASLISIFARLGGGIFTKGADVGADLCGKIEANLPEDDPRNPAVIADNVGDNVGDCAGMAADLFETFAVTIVATMLIASSTFDKAALATTMELPLLIAATGVVASIVGTFFVRLGESQNIMGALYKGLIASGVVAAGLMYWAISHVVGIEGTLALQNGTTVNGIHLLYCVAVGLGVTALLVWITEYYTSTAFRPVRSIAKSYRNRSRHERHPGPSCFHGSLRGSRACHLRRHLFLLCGCRSLRYLPCRNDDAGFGRHDRGARRLRPCHR